MFAATVTSSIRNVAFGMDVVVVFIQQFIILLKPEDDRKLRSYALAICQVVAAGAQCLLGRITMFLHANAKASAPAAAFPSSQ